MKIRKNGKIINLTESDLRRITKRVIKEDENVKGKLMSLSNFLEVYGGKGITIDGGKITENGIYLNAEETEVLIDNNCMVDAGDLMWRFPDIPNKDKVKQDILNFKTPKGPKG